MNEASSTAAPARLRHLGAAAYAFLVSPKLAITLLVVVLTCCVVGVTAIRGERAWSLIFSTVWFNVLLAVLAVSSGAAFFTRIGRRKLTLVSAGMIVFHLSFLALLGGVVLNGLFSFHGVLRLTEGETLPNGDLSSYDVVRHGRFFRFERLGGETTLVRMHRNYTVDGQDKRAAYEVAVRDGETTTEGTIYPTRDLEHDGVRYFRLKEGYSVLLVLSGKDGTEEYGAHVPLQSLRQEHGSYVYATGSATAAKPMLFPPPPDKPRAELVLSYRPDPAVERGGTVGFHMVALDGEGRPSAEIKGDAPVGGHFDAGAFLLSPREVRYWVGMDVRYDPGLPIILGSLCSGLGGMVLTFVGRVRQGNMRRRAIELRLAA